MLSSEPEFIPVLEKIAGPECLTFDKQGYMYTGVIGGAIMKINVTTWEVLKRIISP